MADDNKEPQTTGEMSDKLAAAQIGTEQATEGDASQTSKNALKKAEKAKALAEKKAAKKTDKGSLQQTAKAEAKKPQGGKSTKKSSGPEMIGIDVMKEDDFPNWYQQVLTKGDMLDYYDVSGCYILKPASYGIWEYIQEYLNAKIKSIGVRNCSFPLFVSEDVLTKEKDHIEGFAAEVAWVTHAGNSKLDKKIAIRPTSETVMYPYYAKWIRSHRDLPLRLNQWNSVVRWEFKHPQPFLRSREFLWQEGHTVHLTRDLATEETMQILEFYAGVYEELLAVPVVRGKKTIKEKFAGSDFSTTCEGYIPATGRGIQGATSHHLGQNFSKMFGITVEDPDTKEGEKKAPIYCWQNSWGLSTRVIGVMTMIHSDNKGLVIPPRVAENQVVLVPVGITAKTTEEERVEIYKQIEALTLVLNGAGVRAIHDLSDYSPGWKFNQYELKGIPLRLSFGPKEAAEHVVETQRRDVLGADGKGKVAITELAAKIPELLEKIQADLYQRAEESFRSHRVHVTEWKDFVPALNKKNLILMPSCLQEDCEDKIKEMSARSPEGDDVPQDERAPSMGAKSLCIPFEQPAGITKGETKCTRDGCERLAEAWCMYGRSY